MSWQPGMKMEDVERITIEKAFNHYRGNKTHTAQALDIAIRTLDSKLAKYKRDDADRVEARKVMEDKRAVDLARARGIVGKNPEEVAASNGVQAPSDMPKPRGPQTKIA